MNLMKKGKHLLLLLTQFLFLCFGFSWRIIGEKILGGNDSNVQICCECRLLNISISANHKTVVLSRNGLQFVCVLEKNLAVWYLVLKLSSEDVEKLSFREKIVLRGHATCGLDIR